jgi:hypothetical protein
MIDPDTEARLAKMEADPDLARAGALLRRVLSNSDPRRDRKEADEAAYQRTLDLQRSAEGIPQPIKARLLLGIDLSRLPIQRLESALRGDRRVICLVGKSGAGKTLAASWWLSDRGEGWFVLASRLVSLNAHLLEDRGELDNYRRAPALVVDDLGRGAETEADRARACDLLSERADRGLWTVCTALKMPDYGVSLIRRMTVTIC